MRLIDAWAVRFEDAAPARAIRSYKGQRNLPGQWWSATDGRHVGYESRLERDHVMALDFDPTVTAISSQPFWLFWSIGEGRTRSHAPDYFARRSDGSAVVVDCRPMGRRPRRDLLKFAATRRACVEVGWEYRLVAAPRGCSLLSIPKPSTLRPSSPHRTGGNSPAEARTSADSSTAPPADASPIHITTRNHAATPSPTGPTTALGDRPHRHPASSHLGGLTASCHRSTARANVGTTRARSGSAGTTAPGRPCCTTVISAPR
ncbi:TnsA-like heteromeric transposase endonuclease subunit [Yinghuangia seranimata]|uniref:TnsA-like heteromeric transposase endonuclease subunit n=1 Tax=Yinghuangia seranimata TaxID=408067 RepID=UPI0031BA5C1B